MDYVSMAEKRRQDRFMKMNLALQKELFLEMLRTLENAGNCKDAYHELALVLFGDRLD